MTPDHNSILFLSLCLFHSSFLLKIFLDQFSRVHNFLVYYFFIFSVIFGKTLLAFVLRLPDFFSLDVGQLSSITECLWT